MHANRPRPNEDVVLKGMDDLVELAEKKLGPLPELGEVSFSTTPGKRLNFAARVSVWTMVGLLGAIAIYAISSGDKDILKFLLVIAAGILIRLMGMGAEKHTPKEGKNDKRTKQKSKERRPPY